MNNNLYNNPRRGRYSDPEDQDSRSARQPAPRSYWDEGTPDSGFEGTPLWDPDFDDGALDDEWAEVGPAVSSPARASGMPAPCDDTFLDDDFDDDFDDEPAAQMYSAPMRQPVQPQRQPLPPQPARQPQRTAPQHSRQPGPGTHAPAQPQERRQPSHEHRASPAQRQPRSDVISKALLAAVALVCLLSSFFVSSGGLVENNSINKSQRSAVFDLSQGFDLISANVVNSINGLPKVYVLPMNESPAPAPDPDGYSSYVDEDGDVHDTYTDETITVDCSRKYYQVGPYKVIAAVAKIKISHPSQLRSFFAGGEFSTTVRAKPSQIARQANAVVAINGDMYNYAGKDRILIRNGVEYRSPRYTKEGLVLLIIDSHGDFHVMRTIDAEEQGIFDNPDNPIYHTIDFGPALVVDGEAIHNDYDEYNIWGARNPRSALGQTGPLEYVLVAVEGRSANSKGLSCDYLADLMKELGCVQAYNVDGGQSSMLVFNGKLYNKVSNGGERSFADIIYFASALPEEG